MLLSARMLVNVVDVNDFNYADSVEFFQGDQVDVYFQLVDKLKEPPLLAFKPAYRRFVPVPGATLQVRLDNLDDNLAIIRFATQPFVGDPSIWKVSVLNSDKLRGTSALTLTLNQGGVFTYGRKECAVRVRNGLTNGTQGTL